MKIKTHSQNAVYKQPHFFILNKGNNSGKPLDISCPNCFVCLCESPDERNRLYWLFYGLWKGMFFYRRLIGSVIPYIRLADVYELINDAILKSEINSAQFNKNLQTTILLNRQEQAVMQQVKLIKQAKIALMYQVLK